MACVFVTGSTDGLGKASAQTLLDQGHQVIVHARNRERLPALDSLIDQGAEPVIGDFEDFSQILDVAKELEKFGHIDAIIHNAGTMSEQKVLTVNVVAPYLLTALSPDVGRQVYLSSSMHTGGTGILDGLDWSGGYTSATYSDSKMFVTTLSAAMAHLRMSALSNAVDPGWVATKMGGPTAPDDLRLGHITQTWLAVSGDEEVMTSGGYWHHQQLQEPHPLVNDESFQMQLMDALATATGVRIERE